MSYANGVHPCLYRPDFEKDNCGFGLIAHMDGMSSHWLVETAIKALNRLTHRGAIAADGKTGDGSGILIKKPDGFLRRIASEQGFSLKRSYAVGCVFLNPDQTRAQQARETLARELAADGLEVAGWRIVPTDHAALGEEALKSVPHIEQVFVNAPDGIDLASFERRLFTARRRSEKALRDDPVFYVPSLSSRVLYRDLPLPCL